jgi:hypothetical protein
MIAIAWAIIFLAVNISDSVFTYKYGFDHDVRYRTAFMTLGSFIMVVILSIKGL